MNKKVPTPPERFIGLLTDILEERVFPFKRVFFSSADVDVSIRISAILGGPTYRPVPTRDLCDIVTKDHDVGVV